MSYSRYLHLYRCDDLQGLNTVKLASFYMGKYTPKKIIKEGVYEDYVIKLQNGSKNSISKYYTDKDFYNYYELARMFGYQKPFIRFQKERLLVN
jgi:hypothetical protein